MAINTFTSGTGIASAPMNNNFGASKVHAVYTGTDFNTITGETNSYEFPDITASELSGADYIEITLLVAYSSTRQSGPSVKIETKDLPGSYSDSMAYRSLLGLVYDTTGHSSTTTVGWIHTLTADEKTNGVKIKITSNSPSASPGTRALSNIQTVIKGAY